MNITQGFRAYLVAWVCALYKAGTFTRSEFIYYLKYMCAFHIGDVYVSPPPP